MRGCHDKNKRRCAVDSVYRVLSGCGPGNFLLGATTIASGNISTVVEKFTHLPPENVGPTERGIVRTAKSVFAGHPLERIVSLLNCLKVQIHEFRRPLTVV